MPVRVALIALDITFLIIAPYTTYAQFDSAARAAANAVTAVGDLGFGVDCSDTLRGSGVRT
jgi:hypothetical protein